MDEEAIAIGRLKPVVGVQNVQVFRACGGKPELADGDGWTYAHHQDLAVWKGRLYAAWAMAPKDEDVPPATPAVFQVQLVKIAAK